MTLSLVLPAVLALPIDSSHNALTLGDAHEASTSYVYTATTPAEAEMIAAGVTMNGCWGTGCFGKDAGNCCCAFAGDSKGHRVCHQTEPPCQWSVYRGCPTSDPVTPEPATPVTPEPSTPVTPVAPAPTGTCVPGCKTNPKFKNNHVWACTRPNCDGCDYCGEEEIKLEVAVLAKAQRHPPFANLTAQEIKELCTCPNVPGDGSTCAVAWCPTANMISPPPPLGTAAWPPSYKGCAVRLGECGPTNGGGGDTTTGGSAPLAPGGKCAPGCKTNKKFK